MVAEDIAAPPSLAARRARRTWRGALVVSGCAGLAFLAFLGELSLGPFAIGFGDVMVSLASMVGLAEAASVDPVKFGVIEAIRAPRAAVGLFAGAALGAAGAVMQGLFRNPLADPGLIGVSAGGALAAVAVIVLGGAVLSPLTEALGPFALPTAAFFGSLGAVLLIYGVSTVDGRVVVATMLLAGVAANSLASSGLGYLTFIADDNELRDLTFWTLGSLGGATWETAAPALVLMGIAIVGLQTLAVALNAMILGEADARHLGIPVERTKAMAALLTALGVGAATAVCGIITFVGLVVPHLVRLMAGPDHRYVLPGSACLGAALVLGADLAARTLVAPAELPLGVVTAAIGAPFFLWLLMRSKRRGMFA